MSGVIIGVDPHQASVTIEAVDGRERCLATGRFGTDTPRLPDDARLRPGAVAEVCLT